MHIKRKINLNIYWIAINAYTQIFFFLCILCTNTEGGDFNMAPRSVSPEGQQTIIIDRLVEELKRGFNNIARAIILNNRHYTESYRQAFSALPDGIEFHQPLWHRFGIISHSLNFLDYYDSSIPQVLRALGISKEVDSLLSETIDGIPKAQLLRISAIIHDIGKFDKEPEGSKSLSFINHERKSRDFILDPGLPVHRLLSGYLTENQIRYIAEAAGLHFVLGDIHQRIVREGLEWNIEFIGSDRAMEEFSLVVREHPSFMVEIGLFFLCDNATKIGDFYESEMLDVNSDSEAGKLYERIKTRLDPETLALTPAAIMSAIVSTYCFKKYFYFLFEKHRDTAKFTGISS
jgi:hypothetical protein